MQPTNAIAAGMPAAWGAVTGRQAYHLEAHGTESALDLSVVSFRTKERIGKPYRVVIRLTHPLTLNRADYLGKPATFRITPPGGEARTFAGCITRFRQKARTHDFVAYEMVVEPLVARLRYTVNNRIYQHQTVPQIIEAVLRRHGFLGHQFEFLLRRNYPEHEFHFQRQMSDWDYIHLLMRQNGIYCYFSPTEFGEKVVFGDDIDHYIYKPSLRVPYRETAGLEAGIEAVSAIGMAARTVARSIKVGDYNPDAAWLPLHDEANIAYSDPTTYGQSYVYGTHHLDQEGAKWEAQLRHEAAIASQVVFKGRSNVLDLRPARVLRLDETLPEAPDGLVVIEVTHTGGRDMAYRNKFKAIPADRRFRLPLDEANWPKIHGTLSGRVTAPDGYKYPYLTQQGRYTVRFDLDLDEWSPGGESVPLRLAKPFAGGLQTGFHFPAIAGTEVGIAFLDGNPNRPYITHFHHNSRQVDLITSQDRWFSRHVIHTHADNKFQIEDWEGQEHLKFSTEYGNKTQLTLGHIVDGSRKQRGSGFELRTSEWGALRAGKGIAILADDQPRAAGAQLDTTAAQRLFEQALRQSEALAEAVRQAKAHAADCERQRALLDGTFRQLRDAGVVVSAPAGIGLTSGTDLQVSAADNLIATAGGHADISVVRRIAMAAGEALSFFAQKCGIKIFASHGKVEIQAQGDAMELAALKDVTITSTEGKLVLSAAKEVWIGAGGSFICIKPEGIVNGTPGDIQEKCAAWGIRSAASQLGPLPHLPHTACKSCLLNAMRKRSLGTYVQ